MYKALFLSPMIPSSNIKVSAAFFEDLLNFTAVLNTESYAILQKDHLTIHLLPAGQGIGQMEFYLEVDDINFLWEAIKDKVLGLYFRSPFNTDYGMREIHIGIPCTNTLLFIGQEVNQQ